MADRSMNRRGFLKHSAVATAGATVVSATHSGSAQTPINPGAVGVITHEGGAHLGHYFASLDQTEEVTSVVLSDPSGKCVPGARKALGKTSSRASIPTRP